MRTWDILNRDEEEASPRYQRIFRCTLYDAPPSPVLQPEFLYFVFSTHFVCILFLQQTLFVFCFCNKLYLYFVSVPVTMIPEVEQANLDLIH